MWLEHQRLLIEVGEVEEELGRHVHQCVGLTQRLARLQVTLRRIKERQARVSGGASTRYALDYFNYMERVASSFLLANAHFIRLDPSVLYQRPLSPVSRAFRRIGALFYRVPSFAAGAFTREWNSIVRSVRGRRS